MVKNKFNIDTDLQILQQKNVNKCQRVTGGLAQAGQWLARKFVRICKFIARPNGSGSPAFAKPLGRCTQAGDSAVDNDRGN